MRDVVIFGRVPDWTALGVYSIVAALVAVFSYLFFQKTRKEFANVL